MNGIEQEITESQKWILNRISYLDQNSYNEMVFDAIWRGDFQFVEKVLAVSTWDMVAELCFFVEDNFKNLQNVVFDRLADEERDLQKFLQIIKEDTIICKLIEKSLGDENSDVRSKAAEVLKNHKELTPAIIESLIKSLGDENRDVRSKEIEVIDNQNELTPTLIESLIKSLGDEDSGVRSKAIEVLKNQNELPYEIIESLKKSLGDEDTNVRSKVIEVLGNQKEPSRTIIESLIKSLEDKDSGIRSKTIEVIGNLKAPSLTIIESLIKSLEDKDSGIRSKTIEVLGNLKGLSLTIINSLRNLVTSFALLKRWLQSSFEANTCEPTFSSENTIFMSHITYLLIIRGKKQFLENHWKLLENYLILFPSIYEAVSFGQTSIVELLIERGIPDKANSNGERSIDLAIRNESFSCAQILAGLKVKVMNGKDVEKAHLSDGTEEIIGSGAFSSVFKATWSHNPVAHKIMDGITVSVREFERFRSEANFLTLIHPNIVSIFGVTLNPVGFVLELMPKGSLRTNLDNKTIFTWKQRLTIAQDIAKGLNYLHEILNIIHRDLKAENILLDNELNAKLSDFEFAVECSTENDKKEYSLAGSLPWFAPELLSDDPKQSKASDVYSYGIVLWELTTGGVPYSGLPPPSIVSQIYSGKHLEVPDETPSKWTELLHKCWSIVPDRINSNDIILFLKQHGSDIDTSKKEHDAVEGEILNTETNSSENIMDRLLQTVILTVKKNNITDSEFKHFLNTLQTLSPTICSSTEKNDTKEKNLADEKNDREEQKNLPDSELSSSSSTLKH